jgi:hypothetical protein
VEALSEAAPAPVPYIPGQETSRWLLSVEWEDSTVVCNVVCAPAAININQ